MMKNIDIDTFVKSLQIKIPTKNEFEKLGNMTALWLNEKNQFIKLNYSRGRLLYALIAKIRPKHVLEFGTERGYSTLCMAWAMKDFSIDGTIFTIDSTSSDIPIKRPIKRVNEEPHLELISRNQIWKEIADPDWVKKIRVLTGYSSEILKKTTIPRCDLAYIDAGHFYKAVKHDFFAFLNTSSSTFGVLFDDYILREGFGVKKFIDEEITPYFDATLIQTDIEGNYPEYSKQEYGMCWIDTDHVKIPIDQIISNYKINETLNQYENYEKRLKFRDKINNKVPLLRKIRFQWWNK